MSATTAAHAETQRDQRVTPLELFFDLVFVFAITQVTQFIYSDPTWLRLAEALALLAALWWAWTGYVWLGNTAATDEGVVRVVLLAGMGATLVASLAVPEAFGDDGLVFGVAFLSMRVAHLVAYAVVARGDPVLTAVVARLATTIVPASVLIVIAGALDDTAQALCWIAALAIDYGALAIRGTAGWRVEPSHFAERYGLIVIIALGESLISLGIGAEGLELDAGLITAELLGIAGIAALWWAYFDVVAVAAEHRFRSAEPVEQARIARDSYNYLHLPMVAGIILFALGIKKTLAHVGQPLEAVPALGLCGGVALYLAALSVFRRRNIGTYNRQRLIAAALLVAFTPVATALPAVASLAIVAAAAWAVVGYEALHYADARARIRHG